MYVQISTLPERCPMLMMLSQTL
uniref:Uncharacterized protein n=1 Tax=Romanomermis culicivorax TaxID=13658 RepID=A0A915KXF3_ROMCU